jgi:hypothetical protein
MGQISEFLDLTQQAQRPPRIFSFRSQETRKGIVPSWLLNSINLLVVGQQLTA